MRQTPALLLALVTVMGVAVLLLQEAGQVEDLLATNAIVEAPERPGEAWTGQEEAGHTPAADREGVTEPGDEGEAEEGGEAWSDEFAVTLGEIFDSEKATVVWRLAFPGTASSSLRDWLTRASQTLPLYRLASCATPTLVDCARAPPYIPGMAEALAKAGVEAEGAGEGGRREPALAGEAARQTALQAFQWTAGKHLKLQDYEQHMSLARKREGVERVQAPAAEEARQDHTLVATMLREPGQYAKRTFFNQFEVVASTAESMRRRYCSVPLSAKMILFDWAFEERTQRMLNETSLAEWIDLAHWRWNYFTRGLADDYEDTLWLRCEADDPTTRDEALAKNMPLEEEGASLLVRAQQALMGMAFFGIYDRLAESVELLSFTFCWDVSKTGFAWKQAIGLDGMPAEEHVERGEQVLSAEELAVLQQRNRLDTQLFQFADLEFERRVQAMRSWKAQGFACRDYASECGLRCS